jgi:hypothetical protein
MGIVDKGDGLVRCGRKGTMTGQGGEGDLSSQLSTKIISLKGAKLLEVMSAGSGLEDFPVRGVSLTRRPIFPIRGLHCPAVVGLAPARYLTRLLDRGWFAGQRMYCLISCLLPFPESDRS